LGAGGRHHPPYATTFPHPKLNFGGKVFHEELTLSPLEVHFPVAVAKDYVEVKLRRFCILDIASRCTTAKAGVTPLPLSVGNACAKYGAISHRERRMCHVQST
jgi:hypothetical protein